MRKKWEYIAQTVDQLEADSERTGGNAMENKLDSYGALGWELVGMSSGILFFKREVLE